MIELLFLNRVIQLSKKEIHFPQSVNLLTVQEDYRYCDSGFSYACCCISLHLKNLVNFFVEFLQVTTILYYQNFKEYI